MKPAPRKSQGVLFSIFRRTTIAEVHDVFGGGSPITVGLTTIGEHLTTEMDKGTRIAEDLADGRAMDITDTLEFEYAGHKVTVNIEPTD